MAASLRQLLEQGEFIVAPGVFEMFSAMVCDRMGFKAMYMTGYGVSASQLGLPDAGLVTYTDMVGRAKTIVDGTSTPLIADADTGFGGLINIRHTVRGYEAAGVQAVQIEDQETPKKCGHTPNKRVIAPEEMVEKIKVAVDSRRSPDTLIIARTDSRAGLGLDDAIRRANAYAEAGAEVIFVEAPESEEEFRRIGREVDGWLLANMAPSSKSPVLSSEELAELGFSIAIYPAIGMNATCAALQGVYTYLKQHGNTQGMQIPSFTMAEMHELVGFPDVWAFERKYAKAP